ncbi:hypothetical protein ASPCAL03288 [Aspergillus calidoustus]|uniref:Uncharacterized protein n=1 Tax=Aspergillus calidoustus TaxID=454130 RepID=A0A0U5GMY5_ASPCI|nr:hypothetical protein ASPCAL03288 [Aspergillus calidoustus]
MSSTAASDFAFTTPYVQADACWDLVGGSRATTVTDGTTYCKEATDLCTECLPPSWRTIPPESRYSPSPAVLTTAWCCDYYKDLYALNDYPLDGYSKPCVQSEGGEIYVHTPWHITWQESDRSSLRHEPPTVDPDMMIDTWLPGIIGAGPPEQVPLPTPSEPEPEPEASVTAPRNSDSPSFSPSAILSLTSPGSSSSTPENPGTSEEQNRPSQSTQDAEPTSTGNESVSPDEPSITPTGGGASICATPMGATVAVGFTMSVGLGPRILGLDL